MPIHHRPSFRLLVANAALMSCVAAQAETVTWRIKARQTLGAYEWPSMTPRSDAPIADLAGLPLVVDVVLDLASETAGTRCTQARQVAVQSIKLSIGAQAQAIELVRADGQPVDSLSFERGCPPVHLVDGYRPTDPYAYSGIRSEVAPSLYPQLIDKLPTASFGVALRPGSSDKLDFVHLALSHFVASPALPSGCVRSDPRLPPPVSTCVTEVTPPSFAQLFDPTGQFITSGSPLASNPFWIGAHNRLAVWTHRESPVTVTRPDGSTYVGYGPHRLFINEFAVDSIERVPETQRWLDQATAQLATAGVSVGASLSNKLATLSAAIAAGQFTEACTVSASLLNQIRGLRNGGKLSAADADGLITSLQALRTELACA